MKKRNWIIGSILAGSSLAIGATGIAQACGGPDGEHHGKQMMHMRGDMMGPMMENLDLSKEQRQAIRAIVDAQRDQRRATQDERMELRKALHEQVAGDSFDPAKVRELADAEARIMADAIVQRSETMHNIRMQLTAEQLAKMDSFREQGFGRRHF